MIRVFSGDVYADNLLIFGVFDQKMKSEVQLEPVGSPDPGDSDPLLENQADSSPGSSTEIADEDDVESGSVPCCRICLESDAEPGNDRDQLHG